MNYKHSKNSKTQVTARTMTGVQKCGREEGKKSVKWVVRVFVKDVDQDPFHCHLQAHCHEMAGEILLYRESKPPFKRQCKPSTPLRTHIWIQMFSPSQKNIYIMDSITISLKCALILNVLVRAAIGNGVHRPEGVSPFEILKTGQLSPYNS
jgi:hypothetical protein